MPLWVWYGVYVGASINCYYPCPTNSIHWHITSMSLILNRARPSWHEFSSQVNPIKSFWCDGNGIHGTKAEKKLFCFVISSIGVDVPIFSSKSHTVDLPCLLPSHFALGNRSKSRFYGYTFAFCAPRNNTQTLCLPFSCRIKTFSSIKAMIYFAHSPNLSAIS